MSDSLFHGALDGVLTGVAVGVVLATVLLVLGRRRRWFDERAKAVKERAARQTLALGLVLLFIAWLWSPGRPAKASLAIFAVLVVESAFAGFSLLAGRKL